MTAKIIPFPDTSLRKLLSTCPVCNRVTLKPAAHIAKHHPRYVAPVATFPRDVNRLKRIVRLVCCD